MVPQKLKILGLSFLILLGWKMVRAQSLDKMNDMERINALLCIAKETVLKIGPDFYREYGKPEIKHNFVAENNSAKVYIWGDTGKAYSIFFGCGLGQSVSDDASSRSADKINCKWEKQPAGKFRPTRGIKQEYNFQKEYVRGRYRREGKIK